jgi:hypothetical protein
MHKIIAITVAAGIGLLVACSFGLFDGAFPVPLASQAVALPPNANRPVPVDDDMHHFMEYIFEPNYKLLKQHLAEAPADKQAWKPVKAGSLTLAEGGNLLLMRTPDEDAAMWQQFSVDVRDVASQLYRAAGKQEYEAARGHYTKMLTKCNACHDHFADGEHQLKP